MTAPGRVRQGGETAGWQRFGAPLAGSRGRGR